MYSLIINYKPVMAVVGTLIHTFLPSQLLSLPFVVSMCRGGRGASWNFLSSSSCHASCHCHCHADSVWICLSRMIFIYFFLWLSDVVGVLLWTPVLFFSMCLLSLFLLKVVSIWNQSLPQTKLLKFPRSFASSNTASLPVSIFTLAVLESTLASICPLFSQTSHISLLPSVLPFPSPIPFQLLSFVFMNISHAMAESLFLQN